MSALSLKQRFLSGGAWTLGGRMLTAVASIIVSGILARLLIPDEMGTYFLLFSIAMFGANLGQFGMPFASVRLVASALALGDHAMARSAVGLAFLFGIIGVLLVAGFWTIGVGEWVSLVVFDSIQMANLSLLTAIWCFLFALKNLLAETFRGFKDFPKAVLFGGSVQSVLAGVFFALFWLIHDSATLKQVLLVTILSVAASNVIATIFLRSKVGNLERKTKRRRARIGKVLNIAIPLWINQLTIFALARINLWILGAYQSKDEVALFGAALTLATLVTMPLLVIAAVAPPFIAEMHTKNEHVRLERVLRSLSTVASVPAILVLVSFMLFGGPVMGFVYGDFYVQGAIILVLLCVGQSVNVWTGPCDSVLRMTDHQHTIMWISLLAGSANVIGSLMVVQRFGATGVAFVTCAALILQNIAALVFVRLRLGIWTHARLTINNMRNLVVNLR